MRKNKPLKDFLNRLQVVLFKTFIFSIPFQLAYHWWPPQAFLWGVRVDYLSPKIYVSDILLGLLFLVWITEKLLSLKKNALKSYNPKHLSALFIISAFSLINIFLSKIPFNSIFIWIKVYEAFYIIFYIATNKYLDFKKHIFHPLLISLTLVCLLGLAQIFAGRTIGGVFYFLGERTFSISTPGIALWEIGHRQFLRIYSTFSHPNSLAGFLGVLIMVIASLLKAGKSRYLYPFLLIFTLTLLFTFSRTVIASVLLLLPLVYYSRGKTVNQFIMTVPRAIFGMTIFVSMLFPVAIHHLPLETKFNDESISKRTLLIKSVEKQFLSNPLSGVGLNNFTNQVYEEDLSVRHKWWVQPVHNIYLLVLAEAGLMGSLLFFTALYWVLRKSGGGVFEYPLLLIILSGALDHYWLTLQQNILLFAVVVGATLQNASDKNSAT